MQIIQRRYEHQGVEESFQLYTFHFFHIKQSLVKTIKRHNKLYTKITTSRKHKHWAVYVFLPKAT